MNPILPYSYKNLLAIVEGRKINPLFQYLFILKDFPRLEKGDASTNQVCLRILYGKKNYATVVVIYAWFHHLFQIGKIKIYNQLDKFFILKLHSGFFSLR